MVFAAVKMETEMQENDRSGRLIRRIGPILGIICTAAVLVWVNLFPHTVGYFVTLSDTSSFTPVLAPAFRTYLPYLNIWWTISLLIYLAQLITGRWTGTIHIFDILLKLYGVFIVNWIVFGPAVTLFPWLSTLVKVVLGLAEIGLAVDIVLQMISLARPQPAASKPH
jgi:hypothetical protein